MIQREILNQLGPDFARDDQTQENYLEKKRDQITTFIDQYTQQAHARGWVIGISGGIDSFLVGSLLALSAEQNERKLVALLLPNGMQSDIEDARACADVLCNIYPKTIVETVNIQNGYAGVLKDLSVSALFDSENVYQTGNLQPRLRMMYQYAIANGLLVAGTDHASEAITGFYTKYGDGGVDINPIGNMIKDDIYALSETLGAPKSVMDKAPAAGIGISATDEDELGLAYEDICKYLKGYKIDPGVAQKLEAKFAQSAHKRCMPPTSAWLDAPPAQIVTHIHCGDVMAIDTVEYINEHPCQQVLYVDVEDPALFTERVHKTVNSPIERYNMFTVADGKATNEQFGDLVDNIGTKVKLTGLEEACAEVTAMLPPELQIDEVFGCVG